MARPRGRRSSPPPPLFELTALEARVLLSSTTLADAADTYTRDGSFAAANYNGSSDLQVKYSTTAGQGYNRDTFINFNVASLPSAVGDAVLRVNGDVNNTDVLTIGAYSPSTSPAFTPVDTTTVNWNNQPSAGTLYGVATVSGTAAQWFQWDVTGLVNAARAAGASVVTIELAGTVSTGGFGDFTANTGGSSGPQLVVNTADASLAPTADAYVQDNTYANTNFGSATQLLTKKTTGVNNRNVYATFDTTSVTGTVTGAFLHLWGNNSGGTDANVPVALYAANNATWGESTITWNNQPGGGTTALASQTVIDNTTREYTWDVSSYVNAQRAAGHPVVSFMLQPTAATSSSVPAFNSKEASSTTPQLVLSGSPSVVTPASATLAAGPGTIQLTALGGDPAGESHLTYTWAATSSPSGSNVSFNDNGDNGAKSTYAYVDTAGTYTFLVTISDGTTSVTSSASITLSQSTTSISLAPGGAVGNGHSQSLTAIAKDQFGKSMAVQPTISWSLAAGGVGGTVTSGGLYSAPSTGTGTDTVQATAAGLSAASTIEVGAYVGQVFFDASGSGSPDPADDGVSGFTVYDDLNNNGVLDSGEPTTTTDANGDFSLPPVSGGCGYGACQVIAVLSQTSFTPTTPTSISDSGSGTPNLFGVMAPIKSISSTDGKLDKGSCDVIVTFKDDQDQKVPPANVVIVSPPTPGGVTIPSGGQSTTTGQTMKVTIHVASTVTLPVTVTLALSNNAKVTCTTTISK